MEIKTSNQHLLKAAFQTLRQPVTEFLLESKPDFILYDFPCDWMPGIAADIGASSAYFSTFNASTLSFFGPPGAVRSRLSGVVDGDIQSVLKALTGKPDWIPFESNIGFHLYEIQRFLVNQGAPDSNEGSEAAARSAAAISSQSRPASRLNPNGSISSRSSGDDGGEAWNGAAMAIKEWLDKQSVDSVLYVALGTEATLSEEELTELAHGLEDSGVPFLWILRDPPESFRTAREMLPEGFEERVKERGMVYTEFAPQVWILRHRATRGFLTHCGWSSVIEGLGVGRVLVLLPMINDQVLVARLLEEEKLGVEIPRREEDGWSLARGEVAETVRMAMVAEEGAALREKAKELKGIIGNEELNDRYVSDFIRHLEQSRKKF
ncbi:hypothetical protein Dimus_015475 [Dionaea muscipula]